MMTFEQRNQFVWECIMQDISRAGEQGWMYTAHSGVVHPTVIKRLQDAGYKVLRVRHRSEMPLYYISWVESVPVPPSDVFHTQCRKLYAAASAVAGRR